MKSRYQNKLRRWKRSPWRSRGDSGVATSPFECASRSVAGRAEWDVRSTNNEIFGQGGSGGIDASWAAWRDISSKSFPDRVARGLVASGEPRIGSEHLQHSLHGVRAVVRRSSDEQFVEYRTDPVHVALCVRVFPPHRQLALETCSKGCRGFRPFAC